MVFRWTAVYSKVLEGSAHLVESTYCFECWSHQYRAMFCLFESVEQDWLNMQDFYDAVQG